MKKLFVIVILIMFGFTGETVVHAWGDCDNYSGAEKKRCNRDKWGKTLVEKGFATVGKAFRDVEDFNLRMQYYMRPYSEEDLSFQQWKELYGYGLSGAGPLPTGEFKLPKAEKFGQIGSNTDLRKFILNVLDWVLSFLGILAVAVIIFAGYLYVVGGEENNEKSKKMILYAAIGIIVILSSYAIVNTLITKTLEGGDNFEGVQNYVSVDDVVTDIEIIAECTDETGSPELAACKEQLYKLGASGGYMLGEYYNINFYLSGESISGSAEGDLLEDVQWNFGDGGIYEGSYFNDTASETEQNQHGQITRSFSEQKWYEVEVMGRIKKENPDPQDEDPWNTFIGQTRILVGDIGIAKIKMNPAGNPRVGNSIEFDASRSMIEAGAIDGYEWNCVPAGVPESICTDFNEKKMVEGVADKQKKTFFATFDEPGAVTISLVVKVKVGAEAIITTPATEEMIQIQDENIEAGLINFTVPNRIIENEQVQLKASGAPTDGRYEWFITNEFDETINNWDFTSADEFAGDVNLYAFDVAGVWGVKLKAYTAGEEGTQIGGDVVKNVVVASLATPTAIAALDEESIIPNSTKTVDRIYGGIESPTLSTASCDEFGNCGENANVTHTWKWNGAITEEEYLGQIFTQLGTHNISLTATSKADPSKKSTMSFQIKVENILPGGQITGVSSDETGVHVSITSVDPDGEIDQYRLVASQYGKILEVQVLSGDMVPDDADGNVTMIMDLASHLDVGTHSVIFQLELTDSDGGVRSIVEEESITIPESGNAPPTVSLFVTPSNTGTTSTLFRFFTQAHDPDGDDLIYTWTFPGGETQSGGNNVAHRFDEIGSHIVRVTVFDGKENAHDTETITVTAP